MVETFEWHLDAIFRPGKYPDEREFALVALNQPIRNAAVVRTLWESCTLSCEDACRGPVVVLSE
jgi:hypothetical protein